MEAEWNIMLARKMHPQIKKEFICFYYVLRRSLVNISLELTFICLSQRFNRELSSNSENHKNIKRAQPKEIKADTLNFQLSMQTTSHSRNKIQMDFYVVSSAKNNIENYFVGTWNDEELIEHKDHKNMISKQ